jgi:hypothetical protein
MQQPPRSPAKGRPNKFQARSVAGARAPVNWPTKYWEKLPQKEKRPALGRPFPHTMLYSTLPLGNDRRWGFALADLRTARDAQESQYRRCR